MITQKYFRQLKDDFVCRIRLINSTRFSSSSNGEDDCVRKKNRLYMRMGANVGQHYAYLLLRSQRFLPFNSAVRHREQVREGEKEKERVRTLTWFVGLGKVLS